MTTRDTASVETTSSHANAVVLGVDGSAHNQSAIAWAVAEAERSGAELILVSAANEHILAIPMFSAGYDAGSYEGHAHTVVKELLEQLHEEHPTISVSSQVHPADAAGLIVDASDGAALAVVGKRGLGAFARIIVGSTSIGVAGRATCPTIVVPDTWDQGLAAGQPVLLGVDIQHHDEAVMAFAFERARQLHVPLITLYAWETHPAVVVNDEDRRVWGGEADRALRAVVEPWSAKFPDVKVDIVQTHNQPAFALLEKGIHSQLVVLGRHTASHRMAGFAFGSVTRAVLHYSTAPVAVVPEDSSSSDS